MIAFIIALILASTCPSPNCTHTLEEHLVSYSSTDGDEEDDDTGGQTGHPPPPPPPGPGK